MLVEDVAVVTVLKVELAYTKTIVQPSPPITLVKKHTKVRRIIV